jgi:nucleosome assembly protein 1-like 1
LYLKLKWFDFLAPTGDEEGEPEVLDKLTFDYELGLFFRDRLIPRAVLYFTGEAADEDDDEFDEEEMDEEDEEGEEGQDPDYKPGDNNKPQECKQQ